MSCKSSCKSRVMQRRVVKSSQVIKSSHAKTSCQRVELSILSCQSRVMQTQLQSKVELSSSLHVKLSW
jgi:hypothetical protein